MKTANKASIGKPTHGPVHNIDIGKDGGHWVRRGGLYKPRTGNSDGMRKPKRLKTGPKPKRNAAGDIERGVQRPGFARKYAES